jgi:hypothetical protein
LRRKKGNEKMIKAKKGLLIALFAAMMVLAFGATSVFAGEYNPSKVLYGATVTDADWNDEATSVAVSAETYEIDWDACVVATEGPNEGTFFVPNNQGNYCQDTREDEGYIVLRQGVPWNARGARYSLANGDGSPIYKTDANGHKIIADSEHYEFNYMDEDAIEDLLDSKPASDKVVMALVDGDPEPVVGEDGILAVERAMTVFAYDNDGRTWVVEYATVEEALGWTLGDEVVESKDVIDMNNQEIFNGNGDEAEDWAQTVNAGDYSAWLALKDQTTADKWYAQLMYSETGLEMPLATAANAWRVNHVFENAVDEYYDKMWTAEYSEYAAFAYDTEKKANKKVTVTIKPDVDAIKAYLGKINVDRNNIIVLDAPKVIELTAVASNLGQASYEYWTDWAIEDRQTSPIEELKGFYYDGADRAVAFTHIGEAVTVKYAAFEVGAKLSDGTVVAANTPATALKDADWADSVAIKDAGEYRLFAKMSMNRYPTATSSDKLYLGAMNFTIAKFPIAMGFSQELLQAEYGLYDKASLEDAVKKLFMYSNNAPDSKAEIAQAVEKYGTVVGLFTDAGKGTLYADVDEAALAKDAALAAVSKNYDFGYYWTDANGFTTAIGLAKVGVPDSTMTLEITKIANKVNFASKTTIYHIKKAKKLKKAKSFPLKATATKGEVKFVKISGTKKLKINESGKVTVKKGLKKGTYKIQVKAYVDGTANYASAEQIQTIKVKIKK